MQRERIIESLDREIEQLKTELVRKDILIDTVVNTKGWKCLEKYRSLRGIIKESFMRIVDPT